MYVIFEFFTRIFQVSQPTSFLQGLHNHATSTPYVRSVATVPHSFGRTPGPGSTTQYSTDSSGISSIHGSTRSTEPTPIPQSLPSQYVLAFNLDKYSFSIKVFVLEKRFSCLQKSSKRRDFKIIYHNCCLKYIVINGIF